MTSSIDNSLIGQKLVKAGIITREQLEEALTIQKAKKQTGTKELVGETLVELGYCSGEDVARAIADKTNIFFTKGLRC